MAKNKQPRGVEDLSTLDDLLTEQGMKEKFQAVAIKEALAWQLEEAMKAGGFSRNALAKRMHTSPAQVRRLLNPEDGNVTLATLQRAAELLGRTVRVELV